jgi:hypothetical protein
MLAIRSSVGDIFVMLQRAGINRRHDQSHLRKRKLVAGDFDMIKTKSLKNIVVAGVAPPLGGDTGLACECDSSQDRKLHLLVRRK